MFKANLSHSLCSLLNNRKKPFRVTTYVFNMHGDRNFPKPTEQSVPVTVCTLVGIVRYVSLNFLPYHDLCSVKFTIQHSFCFSLFQMPRFSHLLKFSLKIYETKNKCCTADQARNTRHWRVLQTRKVWLWNKQALLGKLKKHNYCLVTGDYISSFCELFFYLFYCLHTGRYNRREVECQEKCKSNKV